VIGLVDYVKTLRDTKQKGNDEALKYLDTVVGDIRNALSRSAGLAQATDDEEMELHLVDSTSPFGKLLSKLDEISRMLKQKLEGKCVPWFSSHPGRYYVGSR